MAKEGEDQPLLLNNRREVNLTSSVSSQDAPTRFRRYFAIIGISVVLLFLSFFIAIVFNQGDKNYVQQVHEYFARKNLDNLLNKEGLPRNIIPLCCTATVLILPHCEANVIPHTFNHRLEDSCNYLGTERSYYLITQFGSDRNRWPVPFNIVTLSQKSSDSMSRAIETATPIQQHFKIKDKNNGTITTSYNDMKSMVQNVAHDLLEGNLCGQLLVIIPNDNSDISNIAFQFGCTDCPPYWSGNYDEAWELRFVYNMTDDPHSHEFIKNGETHTENQTSSFASFQIYYASVHERFDALQFSKQVGDYNPDGEIREFPLWMNASKYDCEDKHHP